MNQQPARRQQQERPDRVARHAGVFTFGEIADRGLGFVYLLVATKLFGLSTYGVYLLALSVFQSVRIAVSFGMGRSLVRDIAAARAVEDNGRIKGAILLGLALSGTLSLVFGAALVLGAGSFIGVLYPVQPELALPLRLFGALTPIFAVNFIILQAFYGVGRIQVMVAANNLVEPLTRLGSLLTLYVLGVNGLAALPLSYLVALVASTLAAVSFVRRRFWAPVFAAKAIYSVRETLSYTVPVALNDVATRSFRALNILLLGQFLSSAEIGIFGVAMKLLGVLFLFTGSLTSAFRPRIAELLAAGRTDLLSAEAKTYQRWIMTVALLVCGLMAIFPDVVLGVIGPQFIVAAPTMRLLCVALFFAQSAGPLMALLVMSGRSKHGLAFVVLAGIVYTALVLALAPRFGVEGVALGMAVCSIGLVPIFAVVVQRILGVQVYGLSLWKPLAAALVAFPVGLLVQVAMPDGRFVEPAAVLGSVTVIYAAVIYALGVETADRQVLGDWLRVFKKLRRKLTGRG